MIKRKITGTAFRSDYGFSSPNFSVDSSGNIIASSITTVETGSGEEEGNVFDFSLTDDENGVVFIESVPGVNPAFSIAKTQRTRLLINFDVVDLFFLRENKEDLLSIGIQHSSGTSNLDAQGESTGVYTLNIPADFTDEFIYYTNRDRSLFGEITIVDPVGIFSTLAVTGTTSAENSTTGALTVAGGLGVAGSIATPTLNVTDIVSDSNINFLSEGTITVLGTDSSVIGIIDDEGSTLPVVNTEVNNSTIGLTAPAAAQFSSAKVNLSPTVKNDLTNKAYVDSRDIAFSIAFGL